MKMFFSVIGSAISGIAVRSGLVMVGESLLAGTAAVASSTLLTSTSVGTALLGPTGVAIGFGVGIVISVGTLLHHYLSKSKRYVTGLEQTKIEGFLIYQSHCYRTLHVIYYLILNKIERPNYE